MRSLMRTCLLDVVIRAICGDFRSAQREGETAARFRPSIKNTAVFFSHVFRVFKFFFTLLLLFCFRVDVAKPLPTSPSINKEGGKRKL